MTPSGTTRALQRLVVRSAGGRFSGVWRSAYALVVQLSARLIAQAAQGAAVYVKGSIANGEAQYGMSDIDLVAVVETGHVDPRAAARRVAARWRRLVRVFPPLGFLVFLFVYDEDDLARAASEPCLTFGLAADPEPAAFLGVSPLVDELGLQERPGLYGTTDWRRIVGPERRPPERNRDAQHFRVAGWLELQFLSRYLFAACARPDAPHVPRLCFKLIADPARILLKLVADEDAVDRLDALARARSRFPEHEQALQFALDLHRHLDREPVPPLRAALGGFLELAAAVAAELERQADAVGSVPVALDWASTDVDASLLPLVDWRALVAPTEPDETFTVVPLDAEDPVEVGRLAIATDAGTYSALRHRNLLLLPAAARRGITGTDDVRVRSASFARVKLRGIQCRVTDPVSFALAAGPRAADFPNLRGWAAADVARRAAAEHRAWLRLPPGRAPEVRPWIRPQQPSTVASADTLARLLTAARAALFLDAVAAGRPVVPLTAAAVGRALHDLVPSAGSLPFDAIEAYAAAQAGGDPPPSQLVAAFRGLVCGLRPFAR